MSIVIQRSGHVAVDGDMTFSGIDKKISSAFEFLTPTKQVTVDLSGVGNADSAGLALLIEWIKYARGKRVQLRIKNVPNQILNLAKLCGLDKSDYFHSTL
jgi:phospholipid transport system transporter-binding protein